MIQPNIADKCYFKCPDLPIRLEAYQIQKVALVALACIAFFGFQAGCSWPIVAGIALFCSTATLLSEAFLRTNSKQTMDWGNTNFNNAFPMMQVALRLVVLPIVVCLITSLGVAPMQSVALKLMSGNLRMIFLVTVVAPIGEEILFRGFVQERLEDLCTLVDRFICPVSDDVKKFYSALAQSLLFGSIHIMGTQVVNAGAKLYVFCATSVLGFLLTHYKNTTQSLLAPIAVHSAQNTGFTLGLLASRFVVAT